MLLAGLAATLAAVGYLDTLRHPFIHDDVTEVLQNASLRPPRTIQGVLQANRTRPMTNASYAVDYAIWNLNPLGYHVTNLSLHVLNVVLFFALVHHLVTDVGRGTAWPANGTATLAAFMAASVLAVHPMMTEAVTYISGRAELLAAALVLMSLHAFRHASTRSIWLVSAVGLALFVLALGAKETAVMVPVVALAYVVLLDDRLPTADRRRLWQLSIWLLALGTAAAAARVWFATIEYPESRGFEWSNVVVGARALADYLTLLAAPVSQSYVHGVKPLTSPLDWSLILSTGILVSMVAVAVLARKRRPLVTLGVIWFFASMLPTLALVLLTDSGHAVAERRVYLASGGILLAVAASVAQTLRLGAPRASARLTATVAVLTVVLVSLLGLTILRNRVWADPVRLWSDAVSKAPDTWVAHFGLADAYQSIGDCESALEPFRRAMALVPDRDEAYLGLSACLVELDRVDEAREVLRDLIARTPAAANVRLVLAQLEERRGNRGAALGLCRQVLERLPDQAEARACVERNERALSGR